MYKVLELIEKMETKELKKERDKANSIRNKLVHELRLLEEAIRKVGAVEQLLNNAYWEKTEGLGEKPNKDEPTALERIKEIDKMSFDELKQHMIDKGIL